MGEYERDLSRFSIWGVDLLIDIFKKNKELILIWILIFLMFYLTPINGDDWGNYVIGGKDILEILNTTKGMYYSWEGRIVSRFLSFS